MASLNPSIARCGAPGSRRYGSTLLTSDVESERKNKVIAKANAWMLCLQHLPLSLGSKDGH